MGEALILEGFQEEQGEERRASGELDSERPDHVMGSHSDVQDGAKCEPIDPTKWEEFVACRGIQVLLWTGLRPHIFLFRHEIVMQPTQLLLCYGRTWDHPPESLVFVSLLTPSLEVVFFVRR